MRLEDRSTARKQLEKALARFVDEVFAGDDAAARVAFADAQALMPARPVELLAEGREWVAQEQCLLAQVSSGASDASAQAQLASARGKASRR